MNKRLIVSALLASFILLSVISQVSAITGRLGNSRMVLRLDVGEEARRNLLIENVNDVPLTIELVASGDLAGNVEFEENSFTLQPGEEKKAYFTISTKEPGTTETKLNVMFKPPQGTGVGLSANVIVIAEGDAIGENPDETNTDTSGEQTTGETDQGDNSGFNFNPSGQNVNVGGKSSSLKFTPITILTFSTVALIVVFLILIIYSGKLNRKKGSGRPRD
jgi:hypothetical protein